MDPIYLPLVQGIAGSLIGALGGFAVAAYTVHRSNVHSANREALQASRADRREDIAQRRLKLEELVAGVEAGYRSVDEGTKRVLRLMHIPTEEIKLREGDITLLEKSWLPLERPLLLAEMYFPTLLPLVMAMMSKLHEFQEFNTRRIGPLIDFPDQARAEFESTYMAELAQVRSPLNDAMNAVIREAKEIIRRSFEVDGPQGLPKASR